MSGSWTIPLGLGAAGLVALIGIKCLLPEIYNNHTKRQGDDQ